jgi:hypothetical protein
MYRATYPISRTLEPKHGRRQDLQYSNDCNYIANTAKQLQSRFEVEISPKHGPQDSIIVKLEETVQRLEVVASSWLDDIIVRTASALQMAWLKFSWITGSRNGCFSDGAWP